jgi:hypothetical protein
MKFLRYRSAAALLALSLFACAAQGTGAPGVMSQQASGSCLRTGTPCSSNGDCCSLRCGAPAVCFDLLVSPESIRSSSRDALPDEPVSGLGTPGGHEVSTEQP